MKFISTKDMKNEDAPEGSVLAKYLEPSWGGWHCSYIMAYFDNPDDYTDGDGKGWLDWANSRPINVVSYCILEEIDQDTNRGIFGKLGQKETMEKFGDYRPFLGNVGK